MAPTGPPARSGACFASLPRIAQLESKEISPQTKGDGSCDPEISGLAATTTGSGVTVNSVLAGPTRSEGVEKFVADIAKSKNATSADVEQEFFRTVRPSSLLQRFATTDEVAAMVAFVASPLSDATNGAALRVEGGVVRSIL
jgi:enoyl-[acyl-carrier-protein] reductase (NADH)